MEEVKCYHLDYIAPHEMLFISHDPCTEETDYHKHDFFEIAYVAKGSYTHKINGENYCAQRGDIIFLKIGDCHSYKAAEADCDITNVLFYPSVYVNNPDLLIEYSNKLEFQKIIHLDSKDIYQVENLLQYMKYESKLQRKGYYDIMKHYLDILLLIITRSASKGHSDSSKYNITPLLNYIQQNIQTVKPSDLAKKASYNSSYFSKLFKQTMGINLNKYINQKRIDAAVKLIMDTDETIENIAHMVGFNEVNYFYKLFKRYTGCTPLSMRNNNNAEIENKNKTEAKTK